MDLSLTRIRQILAVARLGSFSRAAAELNLSQPALSRSVAHLEKRYGVQIFQRGRAGVSLTPSGAQIVHQMEWLHRNASTVDQNIRLQAAGEAGSLALGIGPTVASIILPEIGIQLFTSRPQIQLQTLIRPTVPLIDATMEGEIELFIAPKVGSLPVDIEIETVGSMSAAFIVRSDHPLAGKSAVELNEVLNFPLAGAAEIPWAMQNASMTQGAFICGNTHITQEIVLRSDMVWITQLHTIQKELRDGSLKQLRVSGSPLEAVDSPYAVSEVVVGKLAGRNVSPLANKAIELCKECFATVSHLD